MFANAEGWRRREAGVRRVVYAEAVSGLGDGIFWVGLLVLLFERGVGAGGFALAVLVRLGPRALISAPAGVLADRMDRRRLLIALDLIRAALMLSLAAAAAADAGLVIVLGLVLATYTFAAPARPALSAALPAVAGEDSLSSANALVGSVRQLMTFVGPLAGAVALRVASPAVAFAANGVAFAFSAVVLVFVPRLSEPKVNSTETLSSHRASWLSQLGEGWAEVRASSGLSVVMRLVFVMYAVRGAELVLYVLVADELIGLGTTGVGVLTGAVGLGALCALPLAARFADSERLTLVMLLTIASTAAPLALLAWLRSPVLASAGLVFTGLGVVVFEVLSLIVLQRLSRRELLGRIFGVVGAVTNAGKLAGALLAPVLVASVGLRGSVIVMALTLTAVGLSSIPQLISLTRSTNARRAELQPITRTLAMLEVFDGASPTALERLAASVTVERLPAGTVVLRRGDPADDLFVVREGDFSVLDANRPINKMSAGDWFGEIGLLQRSPRTATVVATSEAVVWRIPGETFLSALGTLAAEPSALLETMADRLARSASRAS